MKLVSALPFLLIVPFVVLVPGPSAAAEPASPVTPAKQKRHCQCNGGLPIILPRRPPVEDRRVTRLLPSLT